MLKEIKVTGVKASGGRFAIVASKYNVRYVDAMLRAATSVLKLPASAATCTMFFMGVFSECDVVCADAIAGRVSTAAIVATMRVMRFGVFGIVILE